MDVVNENAVVEEKTVALPFPKEDYDEKGNLKRVRPRVLKKLLKYEFKALLKPILFSAVAIVAVATYLFAFGFLIDFSESSGSAKYVLWILTMVIFVYGLLFMLVFPLIVCIRRYSRNLFSSEGYLTLSIPASPEEHILAKRIAQYVVLLGTIIVAVLSLVLALFPLLRDFGPSTQPQPPLQGAALVNEIFMGVYSFLDFFIAPLFILCLFCFFKCWRHRGLRPWMIVLMVVGLFLTVTYGAALIATLVEEHVIKITQTVRTVVSWVWLLLECGGIYLIWRYEVGTLKNKINLK